MKELFYNDESLRNNPYFQDFLRDNPGKGYLKVRASAANEAIPISDVMIKVSKIIGDTKVIFFEGKTDYSGMINDIVLPAPRENSNDEIIPLFTEYTLEATGSNQNVDMKYSISVFCGITVIQYVNITPTTGEMYG